MAIICSNCGSEQPTGAAYCNICGHKLEQPVPQAEQMTQEQPAEQETTAQTDTEKITSEQTDSELQISAAPRRPKVRKALLIILAVCILVGIIAACLTSLIISNIHTDNFYQLLEDKLLVFNEVNGNQSYCVILDFEDETSCQVHTYYYVDNRQMQQTQPYTVTKAKKNTAVIYIGGLSYWATADERGDVTLSSTDGSKYTTYTNTTVNQVIKNIRTTVQDKHNEEQKEMQDKVLKENTNIAQTEFGQLAAWGNYTMMQMIDYVFDPYPTITCEPEKNSQTRFVFTISGSYYFNKADFPNMTKNGTMVAVYDIEAKECTITQGNEIFTAMNVYYLLYLGGAEKEAWDQLYG